MRLRPYAGARNLPAASLTKSGSGALQLANTLGRLFEAVGVGTGDAPILFCNTGHWASVNWFVASEMLGSKSSRLYDGSMAEWTRNPSNPVAVETAN